MNILEFIIAASLCSFPCPVAHHRQICLYPNQSLHLLEAQSGPTLSETCRSHLPPE